MPITTVGCSIAAGESGLEKLQIGTAQLALTGRSGSGTSYRLAHAKFALTGTLSDTLSGDDAVLRRDLPVGSYSIELEPGWQLESESSDGTEAAVPAQLTSDNPRAFVIRDGVITHLSFDFRVAGETIETGDGRVSVALNVDDTLIDDFEADDDFILPVAGRRGGWFAYSDGSNGVMTPALGQPLLPTPDGPDGDLVLHVFGGGFTDFGAGIGTSLLFTDRLLPYDAAAYAGIRFRYASSSSVRLNVGTTATTPAPDGSCAAPTDTCYDDFGFYLPPTQGFRDVTLQWSDLSQIGFGTPTTFDASQLLTIKFAFLDAYGSPPSSTSFDLRLDDLAFVATNSQPACDPTEGPCDPKVPR
ncbi:MAG: hypothetical protein ABUL62_28430 [Myxococcales bacterium]